MEMSAPLVLDLSAETLDALRASAQAAGMSPSQQAARLLAKSLIRDAAKTPCRVKKRSGDLLTSLSAHLAQDFAFAFSWDNLQDRLSAKGYTFRKSGDDLALYSTTTAGRICMVSDLGCAYADLVELFNEPFPKHFHIPVPKRAVRQKQNHPSLFPDPGDVLEDDEDIILFEDE